MISKERQVSAFGEGWLMKELPESFVMRCAIWYHLYNFKNVKNTYGGATILKDHAKKAITAPVLQHLLVTYLKKAWSQVTVLKY